MHASFHEVGNTKERFHDTRTYDAGIHQQLERAAAQPAQPRGGAQGPDGLAVATETAPGRADRGCGLAVGPTGQTRIRIVRPATAGATEILPVILYTHGGGWVLGDTITHDRLVREIANGVGATVIFVDYVNAPEAKYPKQQEQAYASLLYTVEHADELRVDPWRLAIVGDSVGGHMAAIVMLMGKRRGGPKIRFQVLFYPVIDYIADNDSYR